MSTIDPSKYRIPPEAEVSDIDLDQEEVIYQGERLTEARAERFAAEALREVRQRNLVPGRKSLSGNGSHSPTIQYRVPVSLRDAAEKLSAVEGVTVSKLARRALEEYVERHAG